MQLVQHRPKLPRNSVSRLPIVGGGKALSTHALSYGIIQRPLSGRPSFCLPIPVLQRKEVPELRRKYGGARMRRSVFAHEGANHHQSSAITAREQVLRPKVEGLRARN